MFQSPSRLDISDANVSNQGNMVLDSSDRTDSSRQSAESDMNKLRADLSHQRTITERLKESLRDAECALEREKLLRASDGKSGRKALSQCERRLAEVSTECARLRGKESQYRSEIRRGEREREKLRDMLERAGSAGSSAPARKPSTTSRGKSGAGSASAPGITVTNLNPLKRLAPGSSHAAEGAAANAVSAEVDLLRTAIGERDEAQRALEKENADLRATVESMRGEIDDAIASAAAASSNNNDNDNDRDGEVSMDEPVAKRARKEAGASQAAAAVVSGATLMDGIDVDLGFVRGHVETEMRSKLEQLKRSTSAVLGTDEKDNNNDGDEDDQAEQENTPVDPARVAELERIVRDQLSLLELCLALPTPPHCEPLDERRFSDAYVDPREREMFESAKASLESERRAVTDTLIALEREKESLCEQQRLLAGHFGARGSQGHAEGPSAAASRPPVTPKTFLSKLSTFMSPSPSSSSIGNASANRKNNTRTPLGVRTPNNAAPFASPEGSASKARVLNDLLGLGEDTPGRGVENGQ